MCSGVFLGGDEHLEVPDANTRVTTGIASIFCVGFLLRDPDLVQTAGDFWFTAYLG